MPLDLENGLPGIHMRFGTSDTNEAKSCTNVDSCTEINDRNLKLHQWIITNNPDIVESYIQYYDENRFYPIHLNFALNK